MSNTNTNRDYRRKIKCHSCGDWCGSGRKRCKPCHEKYKNDKKDACLNNTKSESIYKKGHISNKYAKIRYHAKSLHEKNIKHCQRCGYDKHIEICHIKGISKFSDSATILEINDITNIIGLCPNCHWEFDHGIV